MALTQCPQCGGRTAEGVFCEKCGQSLDGAVESAPEQVTAPAAAAAAADQADQTDRSDRTESPAGAVSGEDTPPAGPSLADSAPVPPAPVSDASPSFSADPTCPIELRYNLSQVFMEGVPQPFTFEVIARSGDIRNLRVYVVSRDPTLAWHGKSGSIKALKKGGRSRRISVAYQPDTNGILPFVLYVTFDCGENSVTLETDDQNVQIYPPGARAGQVLRELQVTFHNEISGGHAADIQVRNGAEQLGALSRQLDDNDQLSNHIKRIAETGAMKRLELFESLWTPEALPTSGEHAPRLPRRPQDAVCDRLTLCLGDRHIQLIAGEEDILIGRERGGENPCHIVTRAFAANGKQDSQRSRWISRRHARLNCRDGGVSVAPAAASHRSTPKLHVDGTASTPDSPVTLPEREPVTLALAPGDDGHEPALVLQTRLWPCTGNLHPTLCRDCPGRPGNDPACLSLERSDEVPESYLVLWHCAPLHALHDDLEGVTVFRRQNAFAVAWKDRLDWLVPGRTFPTPAGDLRVEPYFQYGLEKA